MNDIKNMGQELPPLPPVDGYDKRIQGHYSAEQMRDYARNAIRSAKQEQACSGMGIDKMAKELLERHTVAVPVAVEDGRCFMVREQDALDAIRAALAATGKQQVGEVQEAREQFEAWASGALSADCRLDTSGEYNSGNTQGQWDAWKAALASRQPVGAHRVDLGDFRELAARWKEEGIAMGIQEDANHSEENYGGFLQTCANELQALIDGRDAGTGVGNIQPPRDLRTKLGEV